MSRTLVLASKSEIRKRLLQSAGLDIDVVPARIDETAIKESLIHDGAKPRDIADTLAEMKSLKISAKQPDALVLGCDQVLSFDGGLLSKPETPEKAIDQLRSMRGNRHELLSAAVISEAGKPLWRHVGIVRLVMRSVSDAYLESYVDRNWDSIRHAVGAYKLEEEGVRLFAQIQGDYFHVLGLPLLELISFLSTRGDLET